LAENTLKEKTKNSGKYTGISEIPVLTSLGFKNKSLEFYLKKKVHGNGTSIPIN
jgi:hypothetical protein